MFNPCLAWFKEMSSSQETEQKRYPARTQLIKWMSFDVLKEDFNTSLYCSGGLAMQVAYN